MSLKSLLNESRAFVIGRISAGANYAIGGFTFTGGVAKAATDAGVAPTWFSSLSVDTMGIIIGAIFTILTGLVSVWAKRKDVAFKEREEKRRHAAWVMQQLRDNGDEAMTKEWGKNWRKVAWEATTTGLAPLE
ncbi:hypothetical protein [Comamonas sp.]|uniref:hypothetical protein n=1 Tax=Comamonas sp. TaxID=34028 RepID=UPI00289CB183|nr:hypothetical protein [Comamonas sp.]